MYQYWFINHNKCAIQMHDVKNRGNWWQCGSRIWELPVLVAQFCKPKIVLKYKVY